MDTDALIVAHLGLVGTLATRLAPVRLDTRSELESLGVVALVQAGRQFNPDLGVPFEAWARMRVRGAMLDWLRSNLSRRWKRGLRFCSLDAPAREDLAEGLTVLDTLGIDDPVFAQLQDRDALAHALRSVQGVYRDVLLWRLQGVSLDRIACWLGVKQSRASQLVNAALERVETKRWLDSIERMQQGQP